MKPSRVAMLLACLLTAIAPGSSALATTLAIGGKGFTEQRLIAELTSQLLRARGFTTNTQTGFSTTGLRREQEAGLIDIYWEYTGTSLITFNNVTEKLGPAVAYERVKALDAKKGLVWLSASKVDNTYALAMRAADATAKGIASVSDLAARARKGERFRLACNTEFYIRPDGLMPLQQAYGFEFERAVRMERDRVYEVLRTLSDVDVGLVFSTDGRIAAFNLVVLRDDRGFFPSYLLTPVVRQQTLDLHPEIAGYLNALSAKLDSATMADLNGMVDLEKRPVEDVASSFLKTSGLIS